MSTLVIYDVWVLMILLGENVDPDQSARISRLIWFYAVRICYEMTVFCSESSIINILNKF